MKRATKNNMQLHLHQRAQMTKQIRKEKRKHNQLVHSKGTHATIHHNVMKNACRSAVQTTTTSLKKTTVDLRNALAEEHALADCNVIHPTRLPKAQPLLKMQPLQELPKIIASEATNQAPEAMIGSCTGHR